MDGISFYVYYIVVLLYSITIHEVSHGLAADSLGDSTAKNLGRLTLNPIKHLDLFGSIILPLISIPTGLIFGYAKPVPYNPNNLVDKRFGPAKVALAGPASNILLALIFGLSFRFLPDIFSSSLIPDLFRVIIGLNLWLAIFNLIPIPPLDGHWLLRTAFPRLNIDRFYKYSLIFLFIFIFFIAPKIFPLVGILFKIITGTNL